MSHLESLIAEYLDWKGYLIRKNIKVGRLSHGGWKMELDVVGYHPQINEVVHYEPSIDALGRAQREARYKKKFSAGKKYIFDEVFPWLDRNTPLRQVAVFVNSNGKNEIAGGELVTLDELIFKIRRDIAREGKLSGNAIPEQYPLLRTIQLIQNGYNKNPLPIQPGETRARATIGNALSRPRRMKNGK